MGVDRRLVLKSLAVYGGVALSVPLLEALNQLREDADELLNQQSVNESTVGRWEATADDYGYSWLTLPPYDFLASRRCRTSPRSSTSFPDASRWIFKSVCIE